MSQAQAPAVATGDSRTVTEPTFPPLCSTQPALLATLHDANEDVLAEDSINTQPDTSRIQAALNACTSSGASVAVELSMDASGNNAFLTGPLTIPSGVTLLIDAGVTLYFSRNAQDYDTISGVHTCGTVSGASNTSSCKNLITIKNVSNVGIMGYGKMNGRGGDVVLNSFTTSGSPIPANATWWDIANAIGTGTSQQNPRWIGISNATNATFYKITLKNAPNFHFAGGGNGVTFWGIKIITPYSAHNTDGIDPTGTNVTITHMSGSDGDDNVAAGSGSSNITVTHNRFFAGHGESIGSITTNGLSNILFDSNMNYGDADVDGTNSTAVRIKSADDRGGTVTNVQYSNSCFANHGTQIQFNTLYNTTAGGNTPNFKNILLQNLRFVSGVPSPGTSSPVATGSVSMQGASNSGTINPLILTLDNVTFDTLSSSNVTSPNSQPAIFEAQITMGPGAVSTNLATILTAQNGVNSNTVTGSGSGVTVPPTCAFTFLTPEITGPTAQTQTVTLGQIPTAVVILSPSVALAKYPYPTGTVTITDENSATVATATLPGTGDTIFVPIQNAPVGTHTYSAAYGGNSVYAAITAPNFGSTYSVTVNAGSLTSTGIGLTGVPTSTTYGTSFTGTATLTGTGTPTGSINFLVNGVVYATAPISSKVATYSFNLPIGSYTVTAVYNGDGSNAGSVSSNSSITVGGASTTTVLAASGTTSTVGVPVTLTATVTSAGGTPTGTVAFSYTNATVTTPTTLGSATLATNGVATYNAFLPQGTDSVVATYTATGNFSGSASTNSIVVTVSPTPPVPALTVPLAMPYTISTIAGGGATAPATGQPCPSGGGTATDTFGDGCQATSVFIPGGTALDFRSVTADPFGNIYFTDGNNQVVHKVAPNGLMSLFAGYISGTACTASATVGCTPTLVKLSGKPRGVYSDPYGNIYIAGYGSNQVDVVRVSDGKLYLTAGTGTAGATGDGGPAALATLTQPRAIATDTAGNIYIADTGNNKIREVLNPNSGTASAGTITTVVGTGAAGATADGLNAVTATNLTTSQGVAVDVSGNIYVSTDSRVRVVCVTCSSGSALYSLLTTLGYTGITNGDIYTVVGTNGNSSNTTLTPGLGNTVNIGPQKIAIDPNGNLYIADATNGVVWFEDARTGWTRVIAGGGTGCSGSTIGDGCPGPQAVMGDDFPGVTSAGFGVGIDVQGNAYVSDTLNSRIRKVSNNTNFGAGPTGTPITKTIDIHYLPGDTPNTVSISSPDFTLGTPTCTLNASDTTTDCIYNASFTPAVAGLRIAPVAITTTLGNPGSIGLTGTGTGAGATLDPANQIVFGQGISANAVAVDSAGNVYVADATSKNVLKYAKNAIANGTTAANTVLQTFMNPVALATDTLGDVFVADATTGIISEITPTGSTKTLPTVFIAPAGLAVDFLNNLYVLDSSAKTITKIGSNLTAISTIVSTGLTAPTGLTVDASGNLFVTDTGKVIRIDATTLAQTTASTASSSPKAVAIDAAGNLLIADSVSNQILAVPAVAPTTPITVASAIPGNSLAMDSVGNVFTNSGTGQVLELQRTMGVVTYNGSGDAPSTFTLLSTGNTAASLSLTDPDKIDFGLTLGTTASCTGTAAAISVAVGGSCTFTSSFTPAAAQNYVNTATFSGAANAILATPAALEIVQTGNDAPFSTTLTFGTFTPASPGAGSSATLTANVTSAGGTPTGTVTFSVDGTPITPASTVVSGVATATTPALSLGGHTIAATYTSNSSTYTNSTATPTTITAIASSLSPLLSVLHAAPAYAAANSATLSLNPSSGTPTGTVQFTVDGSNSGSPVTVASAAATYTLPVLSAGAHSIGATYSGDSNFGGVGATPMTVTVSKVALTVTAASPSVTYGTTLPAYTATITGFVNNETASVVSGAASLTTTPATPTAVNTYTITAALGTLAATNYSFTFVNGTLTISKATLTEIVNAGASNYGLPLPTLVGDVTGVVFGDGITATLSTTATQSSPAGQYPITITLNDPNSKLGNYTVITAANTLTVGKAGSAIALTQTVPATPVTSTNVSTTFSVTATDSTALSIGTPTGSVQFFDGSTLLGTGTLSGGVATITTSFTTGGTHVITAAYGGDANFFISSSAALNEVLVAPGFTASANPTTITVAQGSTGSSTLTFTPTGGYQGSLTLACSGLPAFTTCTFTPSTITFTGNNAVQMSQLVVTTTKASAVAGSSASALLWLPAGMLACFVVIRRRKLSGSLRPLLMLVIAAFAFAAMTGCGGGSGAAAPSVTPIGSSTAMVTASATGSGGSSNITQNVTITIVVTP